MTCPAVRHDTTTAYRDLGCRCPGARDAIRREKAAYRKRTYLHGKAIIDKTGTLRRVQALMALGWSCREISARIGYSRPDDLISPARLVHRDTAERVARLYDRLSMTPGPSERTRRIAARRGFAPPLAWDDDTIDDPAARPYVAPRRGLRDGWDEARWADVEHLRGFGYSDDQIATRLGIAAESLRKAIARAAA